MGYRGDEPGGLGVVSGSSCALGELFFGTQAVTADAADGPATRTRFASTRVPLSGPPAVSAHAHAVPGPSLRPGTCVGEFEIVQLIGSGGFGIVYLAIDRSLQREVAVKEYLPSSLAEREGVSDRVVPRSPAAREAFDAGLRSFVNEARLLARFDHPALVKVHRFWEANGTAYMAMPHYAGPTLKNGLRSGLIGRDEAELRAWLDPLLDALEVLHAVQCYHRDIAPDNILLTPAGPVLLDFGAARQVIGDMTQALTVVLKPGFAPIEQYGSAEAMTQGAWTDLYAVACVVHYAITGQSPRASVERVLADDRVPLARSAAGRYSAALLEAVDAALALRPQDRPQDVAAFRAGFDARGAVPRPSVAPPPMGSTPSSVDCDLLLDLTPTLPPAAPEPLPARAAARRWPMVAGAAALALPAMWFAGGTLGQAAAPALAGVSAPGSASTSASATATAPPSAPAPVEPTRLPPAVSPPASVPLPMPAQVATPGRPRAASATLTVAPIVEAPPKKPVVADSGQRPGAVPLSRPPGRAEAPAAIAALSPEDAAHCAELLQQASLGMATPDDAATAARRCRHSLP